MVAPVLRQDICNHRDKVAKSAYMRSAQRNAHDSRFVVTCCGLLPILLTHILFTSETL